MHDIAVAELLSAARFVKADRRLSKDEANYLVAYIVQYWEYSAEKIGLHLVTKDEASALHVDSPIVLSGIPPRIRRKFPLNGLFAGIDVID